MEGRAAVLLDEDISALRLSPPTVGLVRRRRWRGALLDEDISALCLSPTTPRLARKRWRWAQFCTRTSLRDLPWRWAGSTYADYLAYRSRRARWSGVTWTTDCATCGALLTTWLAALGAGTQGVTSNDCLASGAWRSDRLGGLRPAGAGCAMWTDCKLAG